MTILISTHKKFDNGNLFWVVVQECLSDMAVEINPTTKRISVIDGCSFIKPIKCTIESALADKLLMGVMKSNFGEIFDDIKMEMEKCLQ